MAQQLLEARCSLQQENFTISLDPAIPDYGTSQVTTCPYGENITIFLNGRHISVNCACGHIAHAIIASNPDQRNMPHTKT